MKPKHVQALTLRIELNNITPAIWRVVTVPDTIALQRLHDVVQAAMGWDDSHLHLFVVRGAQYGDEAVFDGGNVHDEGSTSLQQLCLQRGESMLYVYDMGDNWEHTITLLDEAFVDADEAFCIVAGERATPPEDVGGTGGYEDFCAAMANSKHPEHASVREWYGQPFAPDMFDLRAARRLLGVIVASGAGYPWVRDSTTP